VSAGRDPAQAAELERRYRRLLACYPPSHRAAHLGGDARRAAGQRPARPAPAGRRADAQPDRLRAGDPGPPGPDRRTLAGRPGPGEPDRPGADTRLRRPGRRLVGPAGRDARSRLSVGAFVLGAHPQARFRGSRRGDDRLAGGGAAGAGRPTPGRRGGRVRAASAGPGRSAEPGHAADRCLVRRAAHVPVDSRQRPSRAGQPGRLLAGLLGRPAAGPGHRGQPTGLADDRGLFRTPRVAYRRHPGEPFRPAAGFCLRCSCGRWRSRPGRGGPGGHIRRDP